MMRWTVIASFGLLLVLLACSSGSLPSAQSIAPGSSSGVDSAPVAPAAPGAPAASSASGATAPPTTSAPAAIPLDRTIIRQGSFTLTVNDPVAAVQQITTIANGAGGYVATTNYQNQGEQQITTLSIRVPSLSYDVVTGDIRRLAVKVDQESSTSQDVTEQFTDLNAQLRNLKATESQYLTLMAKATTVEDIIKVQEQLTQVQGQIERIQGQVNYIQRRSDLSQIDITLIPVGQDALDPRFQSPFVIAVKNGWAASLKALSLIVTLVVFLWWLIPLALIGFFITRWFRRRNQRNRTPTPSPIE